MLMTTAEKVLELAGSSLSDLAIAGHECNYTWLGVQVEDGEIVDAEINRTLRQLAEDAR